MDREKLDKAAEEYARENAWYPGETSYESDIIAMQESFTDAFKQGADWLMQQPLSERLTDEEREKIRTKYKELKSLNTITNDMFADDTAILEWLFGSDLFNPNQPAAI